jgi:hypothetical protein
MQWVPGALSLGVKRTGREAYHSPPSSAEIKNAWSYTSTPQYVFMAWRFVKDRDNFTFTLPSGLHSSSCCVVTVHDLIWKPAFILFYERVETRYFYTYEVSSLGDIDVGYIGR